MNIANGCVPLGGFKFAVSAKAKTTNRRIAVAKNSEKNAWEGDNSAAGNVKKNPAVLFGPVTVRIPFPPWYLSMWEKLLAYTRSDATVAPSV